MLKRWAAAHNSSIHCASDRVPGNIEKLGHLIARQQPQVSQSKAEIPLCGQGKHSDKGKTYGLFAHVQGKFFYTYPVLRTVDSPGSVVEKNANTPQGHVAPTALADLILWVQPSAIDASGQLLTFLCIQPDPQFMVTEASGNNTMVLDSQSQTYNSGNEHESSLRYSGSSWNSINNGFDSCFLPPFLHR